MFAILPILGSFLLSYKIGRMDNRRFKKPWFFASELLFHALWYLNYLLLGLILYKSYIEKENSIFVLLSIFIILTYLWFYLYNYSVDPRSPLYIAIILAFLGVIIYNELLFSKLIIVDSLGRGYIYIFLPSLFWIGYICLEMMTCQIKYHDTSPMGVRVRSPRI